MSSAPDTRQLGFVSCFSIVVASMVGAGLFTTSGFALADLGTPQRVLAAWFVGGLIACCGAIGYGCLARLFQESGGEYLFLRRTIHPAAGFLAGCVSLIAGFTGAIALAALSFAAYAESIVPESFHLSPTVIAIIVVLITMLQHLFRVRWGARIQNGIVVLKFVLLILFLILAAVRFPESWPGWIASSAESTAFSWEKFAMSLVWISLSYCGFNAAVYVAGEVKEAEKAVPLALFWGTASVMLFYLAMNFVFLFAPQPSQIAGQEQVAAIAAQTIGGDWLNGLVTGIVMLSLFSSVSVMMMSGPRVYAQMAQDGLFPRWLLSESVNPRRVILFQAAFAILFILVASLRDLLTWLGFALSISSALAVGSLFWSEARKKEPIWKLIAAGVFVIATLAIAVMAFSISKWMTLLEG